MKRPDAPPRRGWARSLVGLGVATWPGPLVLLAAIGALAHAPSGAGRAAEVAEALTFNFALIYALVLAPWFGCFGAQVRGVIVASAVAALYVGSWFVLPHHGGWGASWNQLLQIPGFLVQDALAQLGRALAG